MRLTILSLLGVLVFGGLADADRYRDRRDNRRPVVRDNRRHDRPVRRDNRRYDRPARRDNRRYDRPVRRDNRRYDRRDNRRYDRRDNRRYDRPVRRDYRRRPRYTGRIRADRRRVDRVRVLRPRNGRFVFHNGRSVVYRRPVIRRRYYNVNIRPQIIVENYPPQYGYIWVNGNWSWNGREWIWTSGYYAPDPSISIYYDDGSYDVSY